MIMKKLKHTVKKKKNTPKHKSPKETNVGYKGITQNQTPFI